MIINHCEQYSEEYWQDRLGNITSSKMSKFVTSKGKKSDSRKAECCRLAAELALGKPDETYQSEAMKRGHEFEGDARRSLSFILGIDIEEVGLVEREDYPGVSCSPDGLSLDAKQGHEIKCPSAGIQAMRIYDDVIPTIYKPQIYSSLWICDEIEKWTFFSFHPQMKPVIKFVDRNDEGYQIYAEGLEKYLPDMLAFVGEVTKKLMN